MSYPNHYKYTHWSHTVIINLDSKVDGWNEQYTLVFSYLFFVCIFFQYSLLFLVQSIIFC